MRIRGLAVLAVGLATAAGCGERTATFDGPKVDQFNGQVVHEGKPVSFAADEKVELKLFHEKGESFGIPLKPDGNFQIGWMPIGKYSATLIREKTQNGKKVPNMYSVPGGMTIAEGRTEYEIELGKGWKK